MSLPSFINTHMDNLLSNENLIQDPNNAYLLSLKETGGLSDKTAGISIRDDSLPTPIESYETFIDFKPEIREKLTQESTAIINNKTANICKVLRNSIIESHARNSVQFSYNSTERIYNPLYLRSEINAQLDHLKEHALAPWNFDKLPGSNPQSWPIGLDALNERLETLPELDFFCEPFDLNDSFKTKSRQFLEETINRIKSEQTPSIKSENVQHLISALNAIIRISFHTGSFSEIMSSIKLLNDMSEDLAKLNLSIAEELNTIFSPFLEKIKNFAQSATHLHHLSTFCDEGAFKIPKMAYFQKQTFFNTSIATDGAYIYIYVSSSNGGMYKIGTGEMGTVSGKIYAFAGTNKTEEVSWVFCRGKLYLRNSSKEMGTLEIICPNTFKVEGCLQIYCPDIFGHPSLQLINRNYPLLTDGDYVYIIGKKLISEKLNNELKPEAQKEGAQQPAENKQEKKEEVEGEKKEGENKPKEEAKDQEDAAIKEVPQKQEEGLKAEAEAEVSIARKRSVSPQRPQDEGKQAGDESKEVPKKEEEPKPAEEKEGEPKAAEEKQEEIKPVEEKEKEVKEKEKGDVKEKKAPLKKELKKEPRKKKDNKKVQESENEQTLKLCEFLLYEFDITDTKGLDFIDQSEVYDKELIQELYESFNGYFTFNECARALSYNKDDIQNAAQWLVDEGDRERSKMTVLVRNTTLLAQAEVTSDISTKNLKNNVELITKEDSVIFPTNVSANIWTMDKTHVALYSDTGVKVFSKDPKDVRPLSDYVHPKDADKNNTFELQLKPAAFPGKSVEKGGGFLNQQLGNFGSFGGAPPFGGGSGFGTTNSYFPPANETNNNVSYGMFGSTTSSTGGGLFGSQSLFGGTSSAQPGSGLSNPYLKAPAKANADQASAEEAWIPKETLNSNDLFKKPAQNQLGTSEDAKLVDLADKAPNKTYSYTSYTQAKPNSESLSFLKGNDVFKSGTNEKPATKEVAPAATTAKQEKKLNIELKGTYVKTFERNKAFHSHNNFHICYDPYNKRFYTFTWIWDSHTNIFPSVITMTYDPQRYQTSHLHQVTLAPQKSLEGSTLEDYANKILKEVISLQKYRFYLPSRLRNWDYLYGWALLDIHNRKGLLGPANEEEKKKTAAQKAKLLQRLSKVQSSERVVPKKDPEFKPLIKKNFVELKKEYAFSVDGSLATVQAIASLLKSKENKVYQGLNELDIEQLTDTNIFTYISLLFYWVKHADILANYQDKEPADIAYLEGLLYNILSHDINSFENFKKHPNLQKFNLLCWRIVINGWEVFVRTSQRQFKWIQLILQSVGKYKLVDQKDDLTLTSECLNKDGYSPLIYFYLKYAHFPDSVVPEFPLKNYQIQSLKPEDEVANPDDKGIKNITKRSQLVKVKENDFVEPYGRLLIEDLSYLEYVKAERNQFEDLYNTYFVNENQQALKIEKPVEEKQDKTDKNKEKQKPKDKPKGKKKETKTIIEEKFTKKKKEEKEPLKAKKDEEPQDPEKLKRIKIDKEIFAAHEESCKKLFEALERSLCNVINQPTNENILLWKIWIKLLSDSYNEYEKIEEGDLEWKFKLAFVERILNFIDRIFDHYSQKFNNVLEKSPNLAAKIIEQISSMVTSISYLTYQSSVTKNFGCEEIAYTLIRIYAKLKKFLDFQDEKGQRTNILEHLITQNDEGIDYLNEKVLETNHPYEKGRAINFDPLIFPGAIALCVEFDKKCQSDITHDFLSLSSGFDSSFSNIGYFMNHREHFGTSFRISGKPGLKKPLVMLGNCLQADFSSSGQVKDEHSLNRWGFRLKIRPIYGFGNYILKDGAYNNALNSLQSKLGGEKLFTDFVTSLAVLNLFTIEIIELHVKGVLLSDNEKKLKKYLKWNLFKGGFAAVELSQLLGTKNDKYFIKMEKEYQDLDNYGFECRFDALKEEIYGRIAKCSIKKDNKEIDEKITRDLFNAKDPILLSFINDIKEQKGEFIQLINQLRTMVPIPMILKAEKMRKTFLDQYKIMWEQAEGYLILASLHHTGLLRFLVNDKNKIEVPMEPYIRDQLGQIGQKRNEVLSWMLNQIQCEREWQHTLEEISEFRNKYIDEKRKVEEQEKEKKQEKEGEKKQEKKDEKPSDLAEEKPSAKSTISLPAVKGSKISVRPSSRGGSDFWKTSKAKPKTRTKFSEDPVERRKEKARPGVEKEEEKSYTEDEEEEKSDIEVKPVKDTLDFEEKLDEIILKELSVRFEGHSDALNMVCSLKYIDLNKDSSQLLRDLYEICKSNLRKFKKDQKTNHFILEFKSPYELVAQNVIETCEFLVKLNSPFKKDEVSDPESPSSKPEQGSIADLSIGEEEEEEAPLQRPPTHRSFSSAQESQISDITAKVRLKNLRELVDAYQKWKEWHKKDVKESDDYYFLESASPVKSVVSLITAKLSSDKLALCLKNHVTRASQRIVGLQMVSILFEHIINTPFERYIFGLLTQTFTEDYLSNVNCSPREFGQVIETYSTQLFDKFLISFNNKMEAIKSIKLSHLNALISRTKGTSSGLLKWKSIIQQSLSGLSCNLRDIIAIVSNAKLFKKLLNDQDSGRLEILKSFFENTFLLTLLCKSLTYLSLACEHLIIISNNCVQLVIYLLSLIQKLNHTRTNNTLLEIITDLFKKELGLKKEGASTQYQLNARVLQRIQDILVIERINALLTTSTNLIEKTDITKVSKYLLNELAFLNFTLIFHHNAPSVVKPSKRLAQILSPHVDFVNLPTPYDISYYYYQFGDYDNMQKSAKTQAPYKFDTNELIYKTIEVPKLNSSISDLSFNNGLTLIEKIGDKILMNRSEGIQLKNIVDNNLLKNDIEKAKNYSVVVHLSNEEDLSFLIKVLYYWEEKYPTFTLKHPKTVEEYLKYKENVSKKEADKTKGSADKSLSGAGLGASTSTDTSLKDNEKIFVNLPHYNLISKDEDELPIAWMFNMLGTYSDCKPGRFELKKAKTRKTVRKVWTNANLNKLEKKMEEANKTLEEFKEEDTEEVKLQVIKARCFVWRLQQHLKEALYIAAMLNIFGFSPVLDSMPFEKASELANLINLGLKKKLKNIPVSQFEKEEVRKKLDPHSLQGATQPPGGKNKLPVEPEKDQKSEIVISFVDNRHLPFFETDMDYITGLNVPKESLYVDCNKIPAIHNSILQGSSTTMLIDELINYVRSLLQIESVKSTILPQIQRVIDVVSAKQYEDLTSLEKSLFVGITAIIGGWTDTLKVGPNIVMEGAENSSLLMTQGGYLSGKKTCNIISKDESSFVVQTVPIERVHPQLETQLPESITVHPKTIINCFKLLHDTFDKQKDKSPEKNVEISILLRAILRVSKALDWCNLIQESEVNKEDLGHFLNFLLRLAAHVPADKSQEHYEGLFGRAWEHLIDKKELKGHIFFFPTEFSTEKTGFEIEDASPQLENLKKRESQGPIVVENLLPNSNYISSLPEYKPLVSEYKMLKYWEKHIIPKIQDFVRSSYKPYEFEEFFEQLRQPLRKGDQAKAAEIAYILCDQRLPNGCVLPDANHDWSTVSVEEIVLGTWATVSITNKQNKPVSPFFQYLQRIGNKEACVYLIAVDVKSSSVLVNYYDHLNLQMATVWVPVSSLKLPEISLDPPAASFPMTKILEGFRTSVVNSMAFLSRGTILKFFSFSSNQSEQFKKEADLMRSYTFSTVNLIKWSVLEELADDPLEGWLKINEWEIELNGQRKKGFAQNAAELIQEATQEELVSKAPKLQALKGLLKYLSEADAHHEIDDVLNWLSDSFLKLVDFINMNAAQFDLQRPYPEAVVPPQGNSNQPIYYLNNCLPDVTSDDTIAALTVSFKKESSLCMNSGIKFYDNPKGINLIQHLPAGNETRTKLPSLMFKQSKIWFSYYFNSEALPPYLQSQCNSTLQAVVHAIPSRWSVCLWTADALSTIFLQASTPKAYEQMRRLVTIVVEALQQFKGPLSVKNFIFKFLNRCARKMRYLINSLPELKPQIDIKDSDLVAKENFRLLHVDTKWLKALIEEIKGLREFQSTEVVVLYSSYTQELIEYVINCLLPVVFFEKTSIGGSAAVNELNLPDWLRCVIDTALFLQFFKGESDLTEDLLRDTMSSMKLDSQWDRFIYIENLPVECSRNEIIEKVKEIILNNKGRILDPKNDIFLPSIKNEDGTERHLGKCLVLLDGWSTFELEDEEEKEVEAEVVEEEEPAEPELWNCPTCTLENARESAFCDACETPKPAFVSKPAQEAVEEEVKHTDLAEIDQKLKQKEKERLDKISEQITEFANDFYEKLKQKVKEIEEKEKVALSKPEVPVPEPTEEKKETKVDSAEERKERNRKKKQELKELKKKLQEERLQKREKKKKGKKEEEIIEEKEEEEKSPELKEEEEKKAEGKPDETQEPAKEIVSEKQEVKLEDLKKEEKPTSDQEEKKRLQDIIAGQKKPSVAAAGDVISGASNNSQFQEFLKGRLFDATTGEFKSLSKNIIIKIFNQLKQSSSSIIPQYQNAVQNISISDIQTISSDDFVTRVLNEAKNNPIKVWKFLELCGYDLWLCETSFNLIIEAQKQVKLIPLKALEHLMNFMQVDLCKENKTVLNYPPTNIRIPSKVHTSDDEDLKSLNYDEEALFAVRYMTLNRYSLAELRFSWALIKTFNKNLAEGIDFIGTFSAIPYNFDAKWFNLGTYLSAFRNLWMTPIKIELSSKIMQKTAIARDHVPKVTIERLKNFAEKEKQTSAIVPTSKEIVNYKIKDDFIFTKAYEQLKDVSTTLFRPHKPAGSDPFLAFEIIFKGELAMGEAGPYRQFFADISQELQPNNVSLASQYKNLNLLVPSPNNYAKLGEGRDKFVINPSAKASYHLQLFEFLGILMGCSVRTGTHLTLDLPTIFWKQLVNETISIEDLEEIDKPLTDLIRFMGECTKEVFEESFFENYTTMLSDKSIVELKPGGSKIRVRFEDRFDFISKVLHVRIHESKLQIDALRRGLTKLVPLPYVNITSSKDLEIWVCGKSKVDIPLLQRHTRYSGGLNEETPTVKYLWEVLQELSDIEKLRFVKFCWGQERLPANDEEFERTQTRFMVKPSTLPADIHDKALPKADTCFFNLELPKYSTKAILKQKLLLAINTDCDSINADQLINLDPNAPFNRGNHNNGDFEEVDEDDEE